MYKGVIRILGFLSLFCIFAELVEPLVFPNQETMTYVYGMDNEMPDDEKESSDVDDKDEGEKTIVLFFAPSVFSSLVNHSLIWLNEQLPHPPHLPIFCPPPELV